VGENDVQGWWLHCKECGDSLLLKSEEDGGFRVPLAEAIEAGWTGGHSGGQLCPLCAKERVEQAHKEVGPPTCQKCGQELLVNDYASLIQAINVGDTISISCPNPACNGVSKFTQLTVEEGKWTVVERA
jgi:hypothetical protein